MKKNFFSPFNRLTYFYGYWKVHNKAFNNLLLKMCVHDMSIQHFFSQSLSYFFLNVWGRNKSQEVMFKFKFKVIFLRWKGEKIMTFRTLTESHFFGTCEFVESQLFLLIIFDLAMPSFLNWLPIDSSEVVYCTSHHDNL